MAKVLITGASGLLGANLVLDAAQGHQVVAVYHRHPIDLAGVEALRADLSRPGVAQRLISAADPDWVVHCAAATNVDACERDPETAFRLNRDMAAYVAEAAWDARARLIHVSTDAVFDGERGGYVEEDDANPATVYGRSKLAGEQAVLQAHPEAAVVRTNIFGWNAQPKRGLAEWFLANLEAGQSCTGFTDVRISPILVNDLGDLMFEMLRRGVGGVFHAGGGECLSKYEMGVRLAKAFGLNPELIRPGSVAQADLVAPRGRRLCLDSGKLAVILGVELPAFEDGLRRFRLQREEGYRERLRALTRREP